MDLAIATNNNLRYLILLQQLSIFLLAVILIIFIFLLISLISAYKNLKSNKTFKQKLKLIFQLLTKDPSIIFSNNAPRDKKGTYRVSFDKHKSLQIFSRKNFLRLIGLIIIIIVVLLCISSNLNHTSQARYYLIEQNIGGQK